VTLVCGTLSFESYFAGAPDGIAAAGVLASIAAGPLILWRRGTQPLIPISAVYCILMLIVLWFVYFNLAWARGMVDL
jgi:hypothetical protein